jgi:hypothetical protein
MTIYRASISFIDVAVAASVVFAVAATTTDAAVAVETFTKPVFTVAGTPHIEFAGEVTISESAAIAFTRGGFTDGAGAAEVIVLSVQPALADGVSVAENLSISLPMTPIADGVSVAEGISNEPQVPFSDGASVAEAINNFAIGLGLGDSVTVTEVGFDFVGQWSTAIADAVSVAEVASMGLGIDFSEAVGVFDVDPEAAAIDAFNATALVLNTAVFAQHTQLASLNGPSDFDSTPRHGELNSGDFADVGNGCLNGDHYMTSLKPVSTAVAFTTLIEGNMLNASNAGANKISPN